MRSNDTTMPPSTGMHAPESPVPEPRAVTGTPALGGERRRSRATSAVVARPHDGERALRDAR